MNRRLLFFIIIVLLFAIGVVVWFFIYATPKPSPSLGETADPLSLKIQPKRFQFIYNREEVPSSTSTTIVTLATPQTLTEIWDKPATGQTFISLDVIKEVSATSTQGTSTISIKKLVHSTSTVLMFVDRITGHVYGYNRETNKTYQISNTTIPGIYDAYIFNNGKRIVLRYADNEKQTIVSLLANIPSVNEREQAKALENITYLPSQVTSVAVNKKGSLLSYLVTGDSGGSIYTINQKDVALIANTPFKGWSLSYGGNTLYASSKPSAYVEGQTVTLPSFEFVVGGKTGLITNPSEEGLLLNSMWSSSGLKTFISNNNQQSVLNISTIASKCSWGQKGFLVCAVPKTLSKGEEGLPDDWFQGRTSFDDSLISINTKSKEVSKLYSFNTQQNLKFDITGISFSEDNSLLSFNRKQNSSLWLLDTSLISNQ